MTPRHPSMGPRLRGCIRTVAHHARFPIAVIAAAGSLAALGGCDDNNFVPPPAPKVDVATPQRQAVTRYLEATGNTDSARVTVIGQNVSTAARKASPSTFGRASTTSWPRSAHSFAVRRTAATHSASIFAA